MENQTPAQPKKGFPTLIVIVIVIVVLCLLTLCCIVFGLPSILALLGPAVGNVFSGIIANITLTP
jgi:hypothetical protein